MRIGEWLAKGWLCDISLITAPQVDDIATLYSLHLLADHQWSRALHRQDARYLPFASAHRLMRYNYNARLLSNLGSLLMVSVLGRLLIKSWARVQVLSLTHLHTEPTSLHHSDVFNHRSRRPF